MKAYSIPVSHAETFKHYLVEQNLLDKNHKIIRIENQVIFPVKKEIDFKEAKLTSTKLPKKEKQERDLKRALEYYLTPEELDALQTSYDCIGDIIIIQIPDDLEPKEQIIAEQLLTMHKNIKTVVKTAGEHTGEYRTRKTEFLAGEDKKVTLHKENRAILKLNVDEVHFSPRTANERLRVAKLVKNNEHILVLFSGCAPYPLTIAKNANPNHITAIEKNPAAHEYAKENLTLNNTKNITLHEGDVKDILPALHQTFDRIIMPLPKNADHFLKTTLTATKKGSFIHFYMFTEDVKSAGETVKALIQENNKNAKILRTVIAGQYSPKLVKVCVDVQII